MIRARDPTDSNDNVGLNDRRGTNNATKGSRLRIESVELLISGGEWMEGDRDAALFSNVGA